MAATAVVRHKHDLERPISHIGIEGMMAITVSIDVFFFLIVLKRSQLSFDVEVNC